MLEEPGAVVGHRTASVPSVQPTAALRRGVGGRRRLRAGQRVFGHRRVVQAAEAVLQLLQRPEIVRIRPPA